MLSGESLTIPVHLLETISFYCEGARVTAELYLDSSQRHLLRQLWCQQYLVAAFFFYITRLIRIHLNRALSILPRCMHTRPAFSPDLKIPWPYLRSHYAHVPMLPPARSVFLAAHQHHHDIARVALQRAFKAGPHAFFAPGCC